MKRHFILSVIFLFLLLLFLSVSTVSALEMGNPGSASQFELVSAPINLRIQSIQKIDENNIKAAFTWDSPEKMIRVYSKNDGDKEFGHVGYLNKNPLELTFPATRPYFSLSVSAIKQINGSIFESKLSNEIKVIWERPEPSSPAGLTILKTEINDTATTTYLSWKQVTNATKYSIYNLQSNNILEKIGETDKTETSLTYPSSGQSFSIAVSASNGYSEGPISQSLLIKRSTPVTPTPTPYTPPEKPPSAPQNLRVISNNIKNETKEIELGWDRTEESNQYIIYVSISGPFQQLASVASNKTLLKVPSNIVTFRVVVTALNAKGESEKSNELEIEGKKEVVELIIPSNAPTQTPIPTVPAKTTDKNVLGDFIVEEKPESSEDIIIEKAKNLRITPTPTESISNKSPQQNRLLGLLTTILEKILNILKQ